MRSCTIIILIGLLLGCQDIQRPQAPEDLIAKDKMVDIFTDVYLGNAARSVNFRVIRSKGIQLDSLIFTKYGIDSLQFARSNEYYAANLEDYNEIFVSVEERLLRMKARADSLRRADEKSPADRTRTRDSIGTPSLVDPSVSPVDQDTLL